VRRRRYRIRREYEEIICEGEMKDGTDRRRRKKGKEVEIGEKEGKKGDRR